MCPDVDVRDTCVLICKSGCEVAVPDARDEQPVTRVLCWNVHPKSKRCLRITFEAAEKTFELSFAGLRNKIDAAIKRIIFVYPLTGCIHCNRISSVAASGGGGGDGALFIAVTRFLAASFTEFFHSELPLSVELSAQAPVNIFDDIKSYRNECWLKFKVQKWDESMIFNL